MEIERKYDYLKACEVLQPQIRKVTAMEDYHSRPRKLVMLEVLCRREPHSMRILNAPKHLPGVSGGKVPSTKDSIPKKQEVDGSQSLIMTDKRKKSKGRGRGANTFGSNSQGGDPRTGQWEEDTKEAWTRQVWEATSWNEVRGLAGAVFCEMKDQRITLLACFQTEGWKNDKFVEQPADV